MKKWTRFVAVGAILAVWALPSFARSYMVVAGASEDGGDFKTDIPLTVDTKISFNEETFDVSSNLPGEEGEVLTFNYVNVSKIQFSDVMGLSGVKTDSGLRLASNPVRDNLIVIGYEGDSAACSVTDISGKTIYSAKAWRGESIDVSAAPPGLYFVTINSTTLKFIKK